MFQFFSKQNKAMDAQRFFMLLLFPVFTWTGNVSTLETEMPVSVTKSTLGRKHYSGELIFEDNFDFFNNRTWFQEVTAGGKSQGVTPTPTTNGEFQVYDSYPENCYTVNGELVINPTFMEDKYGAMFLQNGMLDLGDRCTDEVTPNNCQVFASSDQDIINPILSARINTKRSFAFIYGRVEVRAKLPGGDWIWPAIWLMPRNNTYGLWPKSGEIDMMESRGNRLLMTSGGQDIGSNSIGSTLHFGLDRSSDKWRLAHFTRTNPSGFNTAFHRYGLEWTPEHFKFTLDGKTVGIVSPPEGGFWELGHFEGDKIWSNDPMSPFDHMFYIILNVAVGGTSGYFPDNTRPAVKPWKNKSPTAKRDFWNAKPQWEPSWNNGKAAMQVDYVRVWAL